jgi:hypothetical protein
VLAGCGPTVTFPAQGEGGGGSTTSGQTTNGAGGTTTSGEVSSSGVGGATTAVVTSSGVGGYTSTSTGMTTSGVGGMSTSTTSGLTTSTSTTSGVGGGMNECKTCSEAINGAPGMLCGMSQPIFDALQFCACNVNCTMECFGPCQGFPGDPNCDQCIYTYCFNELQDCFNDI